MNEVSLKPVIEELENLFSKFNARFFADKLEKPVITVSPDHTRGAYGWCTGWKAWKAGEDEGPLLHRLSHFLPCQLQRQQQQLQRLLLGWRAARLCCLIPRRIIPAPSRPRKGAASPGERKIKKNIRRVSADAIFEKLLFPFKVLSLTCL